MTSNQFQKGHDLELKTGLFFQSQGYLVRRGVRLTVAAGTAEATDVDILSLKFHTPLWEERVIADCKNRKRPHPFERVLWTKGLASYCNSHRALVVTPKAPWQAREFAAVGGIEILCVSELDDKLKKIDDSFRAFGDADKTIAAKYESYKKNAHKNLKNILQMDARVRQRLIIGDPITNLNKILILLSQAEKVYKQCDEKNAWLLKHIIFNAGVVASIMLVRFAIEAKWTPEANWTEYAKKKMTYGDMQPDKAKQLMKIASSQTFNEGLPIPHYAEEILSVIGKIIDQPEVAALTPYSLDRFLFGCILGDMPHSDVSPVLGNRQDDAVKLGKIVLSSLSFAAEVPMTIWEK